ncbi:MAG: tyrosine--tRNA ligase [candidate division KSB1 bacterium]|nr:tyrosine--tRNA ligase [candidate division KSB1 bacterium]
MKQNAYTILKERGFIYQCTDEAATKEMLGSRSITCYVGFDPTADSLQVGNLVPIMALAHLQRCGHRPIVIVGGGTALVGDPSGKTEMRQMLSREQINQNAERQKQQFSRYLSFEEGRALMLNNADWLVDLNYIEFLRDIGRHFSVNRMLAAESYKIRLETGLSFLEFNYMLLQAYDFYILARDYDCELQMGGQDQWGNIVAGADLCRRVLNKEVQGMTFPLIMSASGEKFGKSVAGAIWLDANKTSPFDYYQFWRNVEDADVERFLNLFTFLPVEEVRRLGKLQPPLLNRAKEILAYEATKLTHGKEEAARVYKAAVSQFGAADPQGEVETSSDITEISPEPKEEELPTIKLPVQLLEEGSWVVRLFVESGLCSSNSEARRLIAQGGAYLNGAQITEIEKVVTRADLKDKALLLRAGKKRYKRVVFS